MVELDFPSFRYLWTFWVAETHTHTVDGFDELNWIFVVRANVAVLRFMRKTFLLHIFALLCFVVLLKIFDNKIDWNCTYHPPCRVSVKPNRESRSTDTRIPMIPNPCGVITWPRITDTRLHIRTNPNNGTKENRWREKKKKKKTIWKKLAHVSNVI